MTPGQWALWSTCVGLELAVAVLAGVLSRRERAHRPVAWLFAVAVVADVAIRVGQVLVLDGASKPFSGTARAVYHVETALLVAWPAGCTALAWWAFKGPRSMGEGARSENGPLVQIRPALFILALWLAFSAAMALAFPLPKGWTAPVLHVAHLACAAVSGLAVMLGWERRREPPAVVAFGLFGAQVVIALVGPFAKGAPWEGADWYVARAGYSFGFAMLCALHVFWFRSDSAR